MRTQLSPPLPLLVTTNERELASAPRAYGVEHNPSWVTAFNASDEIWFMPSPVVRMRPHRWVGSVSEPDWQGAITRQIEQ